MSQINLTDQVLARIVKKIAAAARENAGASQSALLNIATAEIVGDGHDWGMIKNADAPVLSRDLAGKASSPRPVTGETVVRAVPENEAAGYLYEARIRYVSQDGALNGLDLEGIAYEVDQGEAIGGTLKIERTPIDRKTRNALAVEFGSEPGFFGEDEDLEEFPMVVEVACLTDFEDLDEDDVDADGNCRVDGMYALTVLAPEGTSEDHIIEVAKDLFHDNVAIACLDDFSITLRKRSRYDADGDFRQDLGEITATPERLQELRDEGGGLEM